MDDSSPPKPPHEARWRGADRVSALRSGLLVAAVVLAVAALRGVLDVWLAGAALAALAASLVLPLAAMRSRQAILPVSRESRLAAADRLMANIPDPVILVDRRALVREANEAARRLLPNLKVDQPLSFALRAPDVLDGIDQVQRTGQTLKVAYEQRTPLERTFEVQIGALKPVVGGPEGQAGVVLFFRDLTAARRLETMRVDFIANVSHELRTPLASLLGFIETLQGSARNDAAARERFLGIMQAQAQRMTRLIDDLLSLSRIELRAHVQPQTPIDLVPIVRAMIDTLGPLAREQGVEIAFSGGAGPLMVFGDRDELSRVAENLIENAVKYGAGGGRIEVAVGRAPAAADRPAQIEFTVRDYGPGIAPEHLPRLTERFYRVDPSRSRSMGGTGLGLAIVKHIVGRHRGRLVIESEPDRGALFRITIPEHAPEAGRLSAERAA